MVFALIFCGTVSAADHSNYAAVNKNIYFNKSITAVDATPPAVTSTKPLNNAVGVSVNSPIIIKFSKNIKAGFKYSGIYLKNLSSGSLLSITKKISTNTLTITTTAMKKSSIQYKVYLPAGAVKDLYGKQLAKTYTFQFKTGVFTLTSKAFKNGASIPDMYTANGQNISPPLSWNLTPTGTKSYAVTCIDPDAPGGSFVHWIIFNIPSSSRSLTQAIPKIKTLSNNARQGLNDFYQIGYWGPDPPSGTHRYVFTIYALNSMLSLQAGATKAAFLQSIKGKIIAQTTLTGKYTHKV